ncbi:MAG: hypothetical protein AAB609_01770 [Patescibacteria group bacterium]
MKKIFSRIWENLLFGYTLFLLLFIPLFPKLPLLDIKNTWVYVRVEDFLVIFGIFLWLFLLIKKKVTLKTPLTLPILIFWIIGAIATIHGVVLIFPEAANVFPNVAFLAFLRHFEYLSLFFIAYSSIRSKKSLLAVIWVLLITFVLVVLYGFGQKYLSFPAYLTMNEEFAKGIPITLSQLSRVPSTFAGHYDLAAYLALMIPILASLVFGFKNWFTKIFLLICIFFGIGLLFMTVSRISFLVLFVGLFAVLFFQNKKYFLLSIPIAILCGFLLISFQSSLLSRFGNTVKEVNVLVDTKTGKAIGHINYVDTSKFEGRVLNQRRIGESGEINTNPVTDEQRRNASPASLIAFKKLPSQVALVSDVNVSNGENLPQGTGYINLPLSPVDSRLGYFFYEKTKNMDPSDLPEVFVFQGDFLIKKASAYDLSFTTRFQGEWPHALEAFKKNVAIGSGYGSVSLAVDNNFLRMLGEVGLLGTLSFLSLFLILGIYIKKTISVIDSKITRSFIFGFSAGVIGLFLNALFIDVFEASKIAFTLWGLMGVTFGILTLYQKEDIKISEDLKKIATSTYAVILYIFALSIFIFSPMMNNFFVADDFTWLRWASDCTTQNCLSPWARIVDYFLYANGFFYRPGAKMYFYIMDSLFWFNQVAYHMVSIFLHFAVAGMLFLLAKKILKSIYLSIMTGILFLFMSGYQEAVFWISSVGHLFTALFILISILLFYEWESKRRGIYFILSLVFSLAALLFHELGIVVPLLAILFKFYKDEKLSFSVFYRDFRYLLLFLPSAVYLIMRYSAQSHWFSGDYSYNLLKLPFNIVGNIMGYISLTFFGPMSLPVYQAFRDLLRENISVAIVLVFVLTLMGFFIARLSVKAFSSIEKKIFIFGFSFFVISLIPFLGLGNIASRYSYLSSFGLLLIFVILIRKLYFYLQDYGKDIAKASLVVIIAVFALWHIIQAQQIHGDWNSAGKKTNNFLVSIESLYENHWGSEPIEIHFVNTPIRSGEAWVFPVGLENAIWLVFENPNIKVFTHPDTKSAFVQALTPRSQPIFVFQDDGSLKQVYPPQSFTTPLK